MACSIIDSIIQTSLADVLSALGAIPAGFRESTLGKLYNESGECCIIIISILY